jgi:hypothetical protein
VEKTLFACAVVAPSHETIGSLEALSPVCVRCSSSESGNYSFSGSFVHCLCNFQRSYSLLTRSYYNACKQWKTFQRYYSLLTRSFYIACKQWTKLPEKRKFCPLFACAVVAPSHETIGSLEALSPVCVRCSSSESGNYSFSGSFVNSGQNFQ